MKKSSPTGKIGIEDAYEVMEKIKNKAKETQKPQPPKKDESAAGQGDTDTPDGSG